MFALGATLFELASRSELPSGGQLYQDLRHGKVPLLVNVSTPLMKAIRCGAPGGRAGKGRRAGGGLVTGFQGETRWSSGGRRGCLGHEQAPGASVGAFCMAPGACCMAPNVRGSRSVQGPGPLQPRT